MKLAVKPSEELVLRDWSEKDIYSFNGEKYEKIIAWGNVENFQE